jgi:hypothetical protein
MQKPLKLSEAVVPKAWGEEYMVFQNEGLAIWLLKINKGESTSLHCHPNKKTGLICLNDEIEVNFLSGINCLGRRDKMMIWPGVFHSSSAIGAIDAYVLEVETPNNKQDLVRLKDKYGREDSGYEHPQSWFEKKNCFWIENRIGFKKKWFGYNFSVMQLNKTSLKSIQASNIVVVLDKVSIASKSGIPVCKQGDVVYGHIFKHLAAQFEVIPSTILTF